MKVYSNLGTAHNQIKIGKYRILFAEETFFLILNYNNETMNE
jgi:hypothetical protein